jgi:class 3 adenylate cyclase/tetratricopeptide (TPR) repeat protein
LNTCPNCGRENADDARFCSACGTALASAEPSREQRKVVTVLFCDLVGSTALGESTDPEALRARMRRYFEDLRTILERHGGSVEKFVGDAVMAVFGIPVAHEDDALRAVRAAAEMRGAIAEHGLEARIGVNTGEVVVGGEGETLVTGDAVNVAARLEQAAPNGEILIGAETRALVRDAVRVEPVEPLVLKGKSAPVDAFRLLEVSGEAPLTRRLDTPLVGRERERQRLSRAYEDAVADRSCQLFTLLGPAGIGKSRLVADFLDRVGDSADVLRGRCLSYGEGITYWPLVEILIEIGVEPEAVIGTSPAETQLAFRRLLEARAAERPQVVVIDDLQWAEPVFVDLVEHVADLSRDAPVFLLCVARTELLDSRSDWGGGKLNATSLLLEPLGSEECAELMSRLSDAPLADELRERIAAASAGNPLFVEEMLAMVREHGGEGEVAVPPTIHALLQARIDSLDGDVRVVMERGSVEGEVFHRGAVAVLSPDPVRSDVESHLTTLVRKELIRSTAPTFPDDEGFRFRHLLIRDAAYESLPKATRAELHERFADWLATHDLVEADEIVGYHVEQSHRYRAELDPGDPILAALATRASENLGSAGRGAFDRGDFNAGRSLLRRAVDLLPEGDGTRLALLPDLASALLEAGATDEAWKLLDEALGASDPLTRAHALVTDATWAGSRGVEGAQLNSWREEARAVFELADDDYGLALYWWSVAMAAWSRCRAEETAEACERALGCLDRVGAARGRLAEAVRGRMVWSYLFAPIPVGDAIKRVQEVGTGESGPVAEAGKHGVLGCLYSMVGEFELARQLVRDARQVYRDAGLILIAGARSMSESWVEWRAGDFVAAQRVLREGLELLERIGDRSYSPTVAAVLADYLYAEGHHAEARDLCAMAMSTTEPGDLVNFVYAGAIEGCVLAREGRFAEGETRCRDAVELTESIDFFEGRAVARRCLAEALALAGRTAEAEVVAAEALAIRDEKGDVSGAEQARELFVRLGLTVA